jgi:hypothetical protein
MATLLAAVIDQRIPRLTQEVRLEEDLPVVLERRRRKPLRRHGKGVDLGLQGRCDHPVDGKEEEHERDRQREKRRAEPEGRYPPCH